MTVSDGWDPKLARVRLPVDFDGPTCAKCKHADVPDRRKNWKCRAGEPELVSEGSTNPVTGDVTDPVYAAVDCVRRNLNGDCELFEAKPSGRDGGQGPRAGGKVGPLADAMREHGPRAKHAGVTVEEGAAAVAKLSEPGPALAAMTDPSLRPDWNVTRADIEAEAKAWRDLQTSLYGRRWRPFDWLRRLFRWLRT